MDHVLALSSDLLRLLTPLIAQGALAEAGTDTADRAQRDRRGTARPARPWRDQSPHT